MTTLRLCVPGQVWIDQGGGGGKGKEGMQGEGEKDMKCRDLSTSP